MDKRDAITITFFTVMLSAAFIVFGAGIDVNTGLGLEFGIGAAVVFGVIIVGMIIYARVWKPSTKKPPRRGWTEDEKRQVRHRQDGRCNKCGDTPPRWDYHHRDGNSSNNSMSNCEGLCPNCHSGITYG